MHINGLGYVQNVAYSPESTTKMLRTYIQVSELGLQNGCAKCDNNIVIPCVRYCDFISNVTSRFGKWAFCPVTHSNNHLICLNNHLIWYIPFLLGELS